MSVFLFGPQAPGAGHPASLAFLAKARAAGRPCGAGAPVESRMALQVQA